MIDLSKTSNKDISQWLANAKKTQAQALGHHKTASNAYLVAFYTKELQIRNAPVPSDEELDAVGVFNGAGSH